MRKSKKKSPPQKKESQEQEQISGEKKQNEEQESEQILEKQQQPQKQQVKAKQSFSQDESFYQWVEQWRTSEKKTYLKFLRQNLNALKNQSKKKNKEIFKLMSQMIESRSEQQCRKFHQHWKSIYANDYDKMLRDLGRMFGVRSPYRTRRRAEQEKAQQAPVQPSIHFSSSNVPSSYQIQPPYEDNSPPLNLFVNPDLTIQSQQQQQQYQHSQPPQQSYQQEQSQQLEQQEKHSPSVSHKSSFKPLQYYHQEVISISSGPPAQKTPPLQPKEPQIYEVSSNEHQPQPPPPPPPQPPLSLIQQAFRLFSPIFQPMNSLHQHPNARGVQNQQGVQYGPRYYHNHPLYGPGYVYYPLCPPYLYPPYPPLLPIPFQQNTNQQNPNQQNRVPHRQMHPRIEQPQPPPHPPRQPQGQHPPPPQQHPPQQPQGQNPPPPPQRQNPPPPPPGPPPPPPPPPEDPEEPQPPWRPQGQREGEQQNQDQQERQRDGDGDQMHGARFPLNSYYDGKQMQYTWGQLTGVGMKQHETLGQILRKQYIQNLGFLSRNYNRKQIEIYSTESNRTIQSAISQLYGLYPPGTGPQLLQVDPSLYLPPFSKKTDIDDHLNALPYGHQIIPIKFNQKVMMDSCQHQSTFASKNIEQHISEYKEMNLTYWNFIQKMTKMFNLTGNVTLGTLSSLLGTLECDRYLNRKLPLQMTQHQYQNLQHLDSWYKQFIFVGDLAKACNRDRFVKILNVFDGRVKNPSQELRWTFLSGHDNNISPMYTELNLSSSTCVQQLYRKNKTSALNCEGFPQFAASLIFQLHSENNDFYVKIRSNGKYMNLCGQNKKQCLYTEWRNRINNNLASDSLVDTVCGHKSSVTQIKGYQSVRLQDHQPILLQQ